MEKVQTKTDHLVADMKQMKDAMENSMRDLIKRNISMISVCNLTCSMNSYFNEQFSCMLKCILFELTPPNS